MTRAAEAASWTSRTERTMSLSQVLAEGAKLPMSPLSIGLMVMIIFVSLLGLVWTFRNTSNKRH